MIFSQMDLMSSPSFFILFLCSPVLQSPALCLSFSGVQYACERWTHSCDVHLFFCSSVSTHWKDNMAYGVCQKEEWEVWGKRRAPVELRDSRVNSLFSENIFASVSLCFVPSVLVLVLELLCTLHINYKIIQQFMGLQSVTFCC